MIEDVARPQPLATRASRRAGCRRSRGTRSRARCSSAARSPPGCAPGTGGRSSPSARTRASATCRARCRCRPRSRRRSGSRTRRRRPRGCRTSDRDSAKTLLAMTPTLSAMTSFLKKPQQIRTKPLRAFSAENAPRRLDLRQQERGALDRAGHQVREERDEHGDVEQAAPRAQLAAIDVDRVAHRLEGVERDADRQDDAQHRQACTVSPTAASTACDVVDEEVEVLEEPEHPEVRDRCSARGSAGDDRARPPCRARRSSR